MIREEDVIIFLGDFVCGVGKKKTEVANIFYESLKGKKIFLAGNHDSPEKPGCKIPWITDVLEIKYKGKSFTLNHYPPTELFSTDFYIHGHTHDGQLTKDNKVFNVSADAIDFRPINLNQILHIGK